LKLKKFFPNFLRVSFSTATSSSSISMSGGLISRHPVPMEREGLFYCRQRVCKRLFLPKKALKSCKSSLKLLSLWWLTRGGTRLSSSSSCPQLRANPVITPIPPDHDRENIRSSPNNH
jgi:hypothetical protein